MGCGCGNPAPPPDLTVPAVMCGCCPNREGVTTCTIDGQPMLSRPCPIGKHPDGSGLIEWAGLSWRGVPWPVRLMGRTGLYRRFWRLGARVNWRGLPGCGCLDGLKAAFGR